MLIMQSVANYWHHNYKGSTYTPTKYSRKPYWLYCDATKFNCFYFAISASHTRDICGLTTNMQAISFSANFAIQCSLCVDQFKLIYVT